jgi:hypothetical protein
LPGLTRPDPTVFTHLSTRDRMPKKVESFQRLFDPQNTALRNPGVI